MGFRGERIFITLSFDIVAGLSGFPLLPGDGCFVAHSRDKVFFFWFTVSRFESALGRNFDSQLTVRFFLEDDREK